MRINGDRRKKRVDLFLAALLCCCAVFLMCGSLKGGPEMSASAGGRTVKETYDRWSASFGIVKIICGDFWGSGVVIACDEDGLVIVSAKHLLMYDVQAQVIFAGEKKEKAEEGAAGRTAKDSVTGQVIGYSASYDLAYLRVSWKSLPTEAGVLYRAWFEKDRSFSMQEQEPGMAESAFEAETFWNDEDRKTVLRTERAYLELRAGGDVMQIGMSESDFLRYYRGTVQAKEVFISDYNASMLLNECLAEAGMSGGGAYDRKGRLVGIIIAGDEQGTICMPMPAVLEEYRDLF